MVSGGGGGGAVAVMCLGPGTECFEGKDGTF